MDWFATDEAPQVSIESPKFIAHSKKLPGVFDRGCDFQSVPHDSVVAKQPLHIARAVTCDFLYAESMERFPVVISFFQNSGPTQSCLRAFKDQKFEEHSVVVDRDAPFLIVISDVRLGCSPRTTRHNVGKLIPAAGYVEARPSVRSRRRRICRQCRLRLDAGLAGSYPYSREGSPKTAPSARSG